MGKLQGDIGNAQAWLEALKTGYKLGRRQSCALGGDAKQTWVQPGISSFWKAMTLPVSPAMVRKIAIARPA